MTDVAQAGLLPAVADRAADAVVESPNGIFYGTFGDTHLAEPDLARVMQAVPAAIAKGLARHAYYFVPLTIADEEEVLIAPTYTVEFGDRAVCHRNVEFENAEITFISTRLMQDRFALAFEFFINAGHHFVDAIGVPESFAELVWSQATAQVRGETSQDAWESRRRALDRNSDRNSGRGATPAAERARKRDHAAIREVSAAPAPEPVVDEKAKTNYFDPLFLTPSRSTCSRSPSTSTTPTCVSANTRSSPRPRWPSASATSPDSSPPTPATNFKFSIAAVDKAFESAES